MVEKTRAEVKLAWGRTQDVSLRNQLVCATLFFFCPFFVLYLLTCCTFYNCSIIDGSRAIFGAFRSVSAFTSFWAVHLPPVTAQGILLYFGWVAFQALLYVFLPGKIGQGQLTPAGNMLLYKVNGFRAWLLSHAIFAVAVATGWPFSASIIADNWGALFIATNIFGLALTFFAYAKACLFPSHAEDRKFSGSLLYDLYMGVELNPRIGAGFDLKLFFNGRPGIVGWSLINASFAAKQYNELGYVTNAMILLNFLHAVYVVDFFWHEDWYLRTIDIAHDHFGYYLAWGDSVWLPFTYTLQSHYLLRNPITLSTPYFAAVLAVGLAGYYIFRRANNQKDFLRKANGRAKIWGRPATFIRAKYITVDGAAHDSLLLTSGFWGISRHFNYVGDLMMCFAFGASCGWQGHFIPFYYMLYMAILLIHRIQRDDSRCRAKYGVFWAQYCKEVPYKLIPYVY